jgi:hypothetical protein
MPSAGDPDYRRSQGELVGAICTPRGRLTEAAHQRQNQLPACFNQRTIDESNAKGVAALSHRATTSSL